MSDEPEVIERVPGVCMDPRAHFPAPRHWELPILGPLTNAKIARYERQGYYGRKSFKATAHGALVYSA